MPLTMKEYVPALMHSLPADTYGDIARKMTGILHVRVPKSVVHDTLFYIRHHAEELEWTVPVVKRGCLAPDEYNRYYRLPVEGSAFRMTDMKRDHHDAGLQSSIKTFATQAEHIESQLSNYAAHEPLRGQRQFIEYLADMIGTFGRQCGRMLTIIEEKRSA